MRKLVLCLIVLFLLVVLVHADEDNEEAKNVEDGSENDDKDLVDNDEKELAEKYDKEVAENDNHPVNDGKEDNNTDSEDNKNTKDKEDDEKETTEEPLEKKASPPAEEHNSKESSDEDDGALMENEEKEQQDKENPPSPSASEKKVPITEEVLLKQRYEFLVKSSETFEKPETKVFLKGQIEECIREKNPIMKAMLVEVYTDMAGRLEDTNILLSFFAKDSARISRLNKLKPHFIDIINIVESSGVFELKFEELSSLLTTSSPTGKSPLELETEGASGQDGSSVDSNLKTVDTLSETEYENLYLTVEKAMHFSNALDVDPVPGLQVLVDQFTRSGCADKKLQDSIKQYLKQTTAILAISDLLISFIDKKLFQVSSAFNSAGTPSKADTANPSERFSDLPSSNKEKGNSLFVHGVSSQPSPEKKMVQHGGFFGSLFGYLQAESVDPAIQQRINVVIDRKDKLLQFRKKQNRILLILNQVDVDTVPEIVASHTYHKLTLLLPVISLILF